MAKTSVSSTPNVIENGINEVVRYSCAKKNRNTPMAAPISIGTGGVVKKAMRVEVVDMNNEIRVVMNKEDAQKRVTRVGGLLREMQPARFERFCRDYTYDALAFREEALRQKENRGMLKTDPCYSIFRIRNIQDLEVWLNTDVFSVWILGHWTSGDWTYSLRNFLTSDSTGWGQNTEFQGRKSFKIALEYWIDFQRIFKGDEFFGALDSLFQLWDEAGDPLSRHDNIQLQYHFEGTIRKYFYELCRTNGVSATWSMVNLYTARPRVWSY